MFIPCFSDFVSVRSCVLEIPALHQIDCFYGCCFVSPQSLEECKQISQEQVEGGK